MMAGNYYYLIPERITKILPDLEEITPNIPGFSMSRLKYLLSTIITHKQDDHPAAYSVLNMEYLKNIIPKADQYLNFLRDMGVIEWSNHLTGRNSRMYRICKLYDGRIIHRTITDQYLIRRIEQNINKIKRRNSRKYPQLNEYVYKVKIDVPEAMQTIEKTYLENINSPYEEKRRKADSRRTFSLAEVQKIQSGQIYIKVNATNGRYDNNFTRLPSELVKHLEINNKSLIELDIKNSQPFFAIALFDPSPEIQQIIGASLTMLTKRLQLTEIEDIILYTFLVVNGKFYDFMMKKFWLNEIPFVDRSDLKKQLFTVFFSRNNSKHYSPAVRLFSEIFPNIYRLFSLIKQSKHNRLAILLQRIESYVILDCVAKKILSEFPGVAFITKHDSVLPAGIRVTGEVEKISNLMGFEIKRTIGFCPKIIKKTLVINLTNNISNIYTSLHYLYQNLVIS